MRFLHLPKLSRAAAPTRQFPAAGMCFACHDEGKETPALVGMGICLGHIERAVAARRAA